MDGFGYGFGYSWIDRLFPVFFIVIFVIVIGVFVSVIVSGVTQWGKNNRSPRLSVGAKVVSRRERYTRSSRNGATGMSGFGHTSYFVTFEVQSGDRMELRMTGEEFGMLAEGDIGTLTFQGTRYLGFERA